MKPGRNPTRRSVRGLTGTWDWPQPALGAQLRTHDTRHHTVTRDHARPAVQPRRDRTRTGPDLELDPGARPFCAYGVSCRARRPRRVGRRRAPLSPHSSESHVRSQVYFWCTLAWYRTSPVQNYCSTVRALPWRHRAPSPASAWVVVPQPSGWTGQAGPAARPHPSEAQSGR